MDPLGVMFRVALVLVYVGAVVLVVGGRYWALLLLVVVPAAWASDAVARKAEDR